MSSIAIMDRNIPVCDIVSTTNFYAGLKSRNKTHCEIKSLYRLLFVWIKCVINQHNNAHHNKRRRYLETTPENRTHTSCSNNMSLKTLENTALQIPDRWEKSDSFSSSSHYYYYYY